MAKTQTKTGKAFEFALIDQANSIFVAKGIAVNLVKDASYYKAQTSFGLFPTSEQLRYEKAADAALNHIISIEPKLINVQTKIDTLTLQLQPDSAGKFGDVRDLLFIRSAQGWEIGISAKNNHRALKHSRLSNVLDFGYSWVGINCSSQYFTNIAPIFNTLQNFRSQGVLWSSVPNKSNSIYKPLLIAFKNELSNINAKNKDIPTILTKYLIGRKDFYKVIKRKKTVEILGFNIHGTLGKKFGTINPAHPVSKLKLPTQIVLFQMKANSNTTLSMICDHGWQFSFRIHSAKSLVETSLKFDINLDGNPQALHSHKVSY